MAKQQRQATKGSESLLRTDVTSLAVIVESQQGVTQAQQADPAMRAVLSFPFSLCPLSGCLELGNSSPTDLQSQIRKAREI